MSIKYKLFCLPYAGGRAEVFQEIAERMPDTITVIPVEYAGHGMRAKEEFYKSFSEMSEDVASYIEAHIEPGEKYALFGYSMGSVVAYEIAARGLLKEQPARLFFASHEAPGEQWESKGYSDMDDLTFAKAIVAFGGFDRFEEKFLENKYFRRMIFDPIREDYRLITEYQWQPAEKLMIPATLFFAPQDVPREKAVRWQDRFKTQMEFVEIGSNHFFIKECPNELAKLILERLQ